MLSQMFCFVFISVALLVSHSSFAGKGDRPAKSYMREPKRGDFIELQDYKDAWREWRKLRDRLNEKARKLKAKKGAKASDHSLATLRRVRRLGQSFASGTEPSSLDQIAQTHIEALSQVLSPASSSVSSAASAASTGVSSVGAMGARGATGMYVFGLAPSTDDAFFGGSSLLMGLLPDGRSLSQDSSADAFTWGAGHASADPDIDLRQAPSLSSCSSLWMEGLAQGLHPHDPLMSDLGVLCSMGDTQEALDAGVGVMMSPTASDESAADLSRAFVGSEDLVLGSSASAADSLDLFTPLWPQAFFDSLAPQPSQTVSDDETAQDLLLTGPDPVSGFDPYSFLADNEDDLEL